MKCCGYDFDQMRSGKVVKIESKSQSDELFRVHLLTHFKLDCFRVMW